jgi:hypothetical protein
MSAMCSELAEAAGEALAGTATTAVRWLLLEVPGAWPRDVADAAALPAEARGAIDVWLAGGRSSRLQFIRRPGHTSERLLAFAVTSQEQIGEIRRLELGSHADLAELDLDVDGTPVDGSLLLVCGHGSRDRCCAVRGTPLYTALAERLGEEEVWISSHQGGHRFAPNLLVLPSGLQFGRVPLAEAPFLAARALAGRIALDRYRGRTCFEAHVQAAELAVRRAAGLEGLAEIALEAVEDGVVTFRTWDDEEYAVVVHEVQGPPTPASCGDEPSSHLHFRAESVTHRPALNDGGDRRGR